jgi:hydroxymethylpyrimidine/phosphomethylpyrimidine kinase
MPTSLRSALTIAGSDSSSGAGIQADLKTFAALGLYGLCAVTTVTAQNTVGVTATYPLPADLVTAQIEAVAGDVGIHATKVGMLATAAIVEAVAAAIEELDLPNVVVDPVVIAKSGDRLLAPDALQTLCHELLPRARVVTPNIPEAALLTGLSISSLEDVHEAAGKIHAMGVTGVVIKGGHGNGDVLVDVLFDGTRFFEFRTPRIDTRHTHGTGCTFAAALAGYLALDFSLADASRHAQAYVAGAIRHALAIGHGHGPLDHFWNTP